MVKSLTSVLCSRPAKAAIHVPDRRSFRHPCRFTFVFNDENGDDDNDANASSTLPLADVRFFPPPLLTGVQEIMPGRAYGEAVHGGGEEQPHGLHLGVAVHRLWYLRQKGE